MEIKNGATYSNKGTGLKVTVYAVAKDIPTGEEKVVFLSHNSESPCAMNKQAFMALFEEVGEC